MVKFEPIYLPYWSRMRKGILGILIAGSLLTAMVFFYDLAKFRTAVILVFGSTFIYNFYRLAKRSERYLKSITISEKDVELIIDEVDNPVIIKSELQNTRIKVVELFFGFTSWGRNFKLQIDVKKNGKYETVFEQYEIGKWHLGIFKRIHSEYCELKNIPKGLSSLKRSNF